MSHPAAHRRLGRRDQKASYRRVLHPLIVPEANPPIPFVSQPFAAQRGINIAANILAKADHDTASREGAAGRDVGEPGIASTSSPSRLFSCRQGHLHLTRLSY